MDALRSSGASYALIGGFAVAYHGLPRPTRDIDLLVSVPRVRLPGVLEAFRDRGFTFDPDAVLRELGEDHLSSIRYASVRVDLLDAVIPFFRRTVASAINAEVHGHEVRIARGEDLIVLKMIAGREDDLRDVKGILAVEGGSLDVDDIRRSLAECCDRTRMETFERLVVESASGG